MARFLKPGGYGHFARPGEPYSERVYDAGLGVDDKPLDGDDWANLLQSGHRTEMHLQLDGIPWIFPERRLVDVYGREVQAPADYSVCEALFVDDSIETSCDADREAGLAAGRQIDLVLAWQAIEDYGLTTALFSVPSIQTPLTSSVSDATATSIEVEGTSDFTAGVGYYLGHEYIIPSTLDATSFEGVRRGVCGKPHYHVSETGSGYRYVTDTPTFWRRRQVVVWEILVSPEGRALGGQYATLGPYVRQAWRGYIDEDPQVGDTGMVLSALPLERLLDEEIGVKLSGEINFDAEGFPYPLGFDAEDQIRIREEAGSMADAIGPNNPGNVSIGSLPNWRAIAQQNLEADVTPDVIWLKLLSDRWALRIECIFDGESYHGFTVYPSGCWFLPQDNFRVVGGPSFAKVDIPLDMNRVGCWISVRFNQDEDSSIADLPSSGTAILEVQGTREMVTWDEVRTLSTADPRVALRLSGRGIGGTTQVDWTLGGSFTVVAGWRGAWREVLLTLATSSGLGTHGAYDTLPAGFGLGLGIDDFEPRGLDIDGPELEVFAEEKTSIADLLCGWLALQRKCIVQRLGDDGKIRLAVVSTEPSSDTTAVEIGKADVLIGGHGVPKKVPAPNSVKIDPGNAGQPFIVRGLANAQTEGPRRWEIKAPGMREPDAIRYAKALMRLAAGQSTLDMEVPPWSQIQPGDAIVLTTAHPLAYSWTSGERGPASINARCVGVGRRWAGTKRVSLILAGQAQETYLLAPSPVLTHIAGDRHIFRIALDQARWFAAGEDVHIYNPGGEASGESQDNTISAIDLGETEAVITVSNPALGSWAVPWITRMTYPTAASASARQVGFMYVRGSRYWR